MLYLNELLELPIFNHFCIIAGQKGLHREIRNVDILEYEWYNKNFNVFNKDDFVLTSLFFAKDEPQIIYESFKKLIKREVSAIAIKTVFYTELPPEVIKLADTYDIPLFLFADAYMEDIIVNFNDLLKTKQQFLFLEEKITELIAPKKDLYNIENAAREINNSFLPQIIAFYLINKKQPDSPREIANYLNRLLYKKYRDSQLYYVSYLKYKNGLLILYSFDRRQKIDNEQLICQKLLQNYDIAADEFYIGISMAKETFVSLPMAIQESIDACHICQQQEKNYLYYKELGIYRTLLPLNNNTAVQQHISAIIQALKKYDDKYTSNLQETLLCYVRCNGEISKTAAELFQHPNTIRYRLQKAKKILRPFLGNENFYEQLFILITLYLLQGKINRYNFQQ